MTEPEKTVDPDWTILRNWVSEKLKSQNLCDKRIYPSRTKRLTADLMPAILIYTTGEESEEYNVSPRSYKNSLGIAVEVFSAAGEGRLDDELDGLCEDIKNILLTFGPQPEFSKITYDSAEPSYTEDGNKSHGTVVLHFTIVYESQHFSDRTRLSESTKYNMTLNPLPTVAERPVMESTYQEE